MCSASGAVSPRRQNPSPQLSPPTPLDPLQQNILHLERQDFRMKGLGDHGSCVTLPKRKPKPTGWGGRSWVHSRRAASSASESCLCLSSQASLAFSARGPGSAFPRRGPPASSRCMATGEAGYPPSVTSLCSADLRDEEDVRGRLGPSGASQQPNASRDPTRDRAGRAPVSRCRAGSATDRVLPARPPAGKAVAPTLRGSKPRACASCQ